MRSGARTRAASHPGSSQSRLGHQMSIGHRGQRLSGAGRAGVLSSEAFIPSTPPHVAGNPFGTASPTGGLGCLLTWSVAAQLGCDNNNLPPDRNRTKTSRRLASCSGAVDPDLTNRARLTSRQRVRRHETAVERGCVRSGAHRRLSWRLTMARSPMGARSTRHRSGARVWCSGLVCTARHSD
jgi:hypothetical protein